jgi:hypothetical protein
MENLTAGSTNTSIAKSTDGRTLAALFCGALPSVRANKNHSSILFIEAFSFPIFRLVSKREQDSLLVVPRQELCDSYERLLIITWLSRELLRQYETTWRNIPEDSHLHTRRRENLKLLIVCHHVSAVRSYHFYIRLFV